MQALRRQLDQIFANLSESRAFSYAEQIFARLGQTIHSAKRRATDAVAPAPTELHWPTELLCIFQASDLSLPFQFVNKQGRAVREQVHTWLRILVCELVLRLQMRYSVGVWRRDMGPMMPYGELSSRIALTAHNPLYHFADGYRTSSATKRGRWIRVSGQETGLAAQPREPSRKLNPVYYPSMAPVKGSTCDDRKITLLANVPESAARTFLIATGMCGAVLEPDEALTVLVKSEANEIYDGIARSLLAYLFYETKTFVGHHHVPNTYGRSQPVWIGTSFAGSINKRSDPVFNFTMHGGGEVPVRGDVGEKLDRALGLVHFLCNDKYLVGIPKMRTWPVADTCSSIKWLLREISLGNFDDFPRAFLTQIDAFHRYLAFDCNLTRQWRDAIVANQIQAGPPPMDMLTDRVITPGERALDRLVF